MVADFASLSRFFRVLYIPLDPFSGFCGMKLHSCTRSTNNEIPVLGLSHLPCWVITSNHVSLVFTFRVLILHAAARWHLSSQRSSKWRYFGAFLYVLAHVCLYATRAVFSLFKLLNTKEMHPEELSAIAGRGSGSAYRRWGVSRGGRYIIVNGPTLPSMCYPLTTTCLKYAFFMQRLPPPERAPFKIEIPGITV